MVAIKGDIFKNPLDSLEINNNPKNDILMKKVLFIAFHTINNYMNM